MRYATPLRVCLIETVGVDAKSRNELLAVLEEYAQKVDSEAERLKANPMPPMQLAGAASQMAESCRDETDDWIKAHPQVRDAVEKMRAELERIFFALGEDGDWVKIKRALLNAGADARQIERANVVLDEAYIRSRNLGLSIDKRRLAARETPEGHPARLASSTIIAEAEIAKYEIGAMVREGLMALLPVDHRARLDEGLAGMGPAQ